MQLGLTEVCRGIWGQCLGVPLGVAEGEADRVGEWLLVREALGVAVREADCVAVRLGVRVPVEEAEREAEGVREAETLSVGLCVVVVVVEAEVEVEPEAVTVSDGVGVAEGLPEGVLVLVRVSGIGILQGVWGGVRGCWSAARAISETGTKNHMSLLTCPD